MQRKVKKGWLRHAYWILNTIATVYSFIITFFYWSVLHDPGKCMTYNNLFMKFNILIFHHICFDLITFSLTERDKIDAINLMVYVFNSVIMFVDLMTVTHPINLSHTYWTMSIGIIYVLFTVVYFISGGTTR